MHAKFGNITVSSRHIRQTFVNSISSALISDIDGIEVRYKDNKILFQIGCLFVLAGAIMFVEAPMEAGLMAIIGALLMAAYYSTRRVSLMVHCGNMVIVQELSGNGLEKVTEFIDQVEAIRIDSQESRTLESETKSETA